MLGFSYNHQCIQKQVTIFGALFNDISINRLDANNVLIDSMTVPLSYGPKEKFLGRINEDPNLNRPASVMPRMSFVLNQLTYDSDRALNNQNKNTAMLINDYTRLQYTLMPVPYNFSMELDVLVKNVTDGNQIIEQILPFFTPSWDLKTILIPEIGYMTSIPIILNSVTNTDTYEADFLTRRALIWSLQFTMKGWLFGPTREGRIINTAEIQFTDDTFTINESGVIITPGLTANGEPTSNAVLSLPPNQIPANSNFGFITDYY